MSLNCPAATDPNSQWPPMCPNIGAAYFFTILFGLTFIAHTVQMFWSRKPYSWVIVVSAALQVVAYVGRVMSIQQYTNSTVYSIWFIVMMVAPVWTNAYAYMVMGRMVYNFIPAASVFAVRAWHFGLIFVLLDVVAFLAQAAGASMASGADIPMDQLMRGIHIYMGGIGFQQLCIFAFLALAARFHMHLLRNRHQQDPQDTRTALKLLYVEYAVVLLITVRIIFRLIEYSNGITSSIPRHEVFQYVFDSTPMFIALVLFNIWHPGFLMPGQASNMPKRKERKALKKQGLTAMGRLAGQNREKEYTAVDVSSRTPSPMPQAAGVDVERGVTEGHMGWRS